MYDTHMERVWFVQEAEQKHQTTRICKHEKLIFFF